MWLYNIIGGEYKEEPFEGEANRIRLVTAANDKRNPIAAYRDVSEKEVRKAIEKCLEGASYFKSLPDKTTQELNRVWAHLMLNSELDYQNASVLNGPIKVIERDKNMISENILLGEQYLDYIREHPDDINAIQFNTKTAFSVVNASMRVTPAYAGIGTKRRKISTITRPESARPIPGYEIEYTFIQAWKYLQEKGLIKKHEFAPSQVLFWDNRVHRDFGKLIGDAVDVIPYMGHPLTAWYMLNGQDFRLIVNSQQAEVSLQKHRKNTPLDSKVLFYVSNKTAVFVGGKGLDNSTLDDMIEEIAFSTTSHDLSCKRTICNTIEEDKFDYTKEGLIKEFSMYNIGEVGDSEAQIVRKSSDQWTDVESYLSLAKKLDFEIIKCGSHQQSPRLIIIENPEKYLNQENKELFNGFKYFLSLECKHPVMILNKGTKETSHELAKLMASRNHEGRNLQRYIYTTDPEVIDYFHAPDSAARQNPELIRKATDGYDLYVWGDGPATDGLGNLVDMNNIPVKNPRIRGHEYKMV